MLLLFSVDALGGRVATLYGLTPPARFPPLLTPWTTLTIEEAPAPEGPWATIEVLALDPLDSNPREPLDRTLSTTRTTLDEGWYRVVWSDADGATSAPSDAVPRLLAPIEAPSLEEVGALMHARTTRRGGSEAGTFTASSRPTAEQVAGLVQQATGLVLASIGTLPPVTTADTAALRNAVRTLIAMRTALFIEPSLWPEQITGAASPYVALREQYEAELPRIVDAARDISAGGAIVPGELDTAGDLAALPPGNAAWAFPPLVGYDTVQW